MGKLTSPGRSSVRLWRRAAAIMVVALAALPSVAPRELAARPCPPGTGPNFELPPDLDPKIGEQYRAALKAFEAAESAEEGATGKIEKAVKLLKAAQAAAPRFAPPLYYLGIAYQWTKEFDRARAVLKQALEINPKFHEAIVELADTYVWLKQFDRAWPEYERAIALKPEYAHAYAARGFARLRAGDLAGAASDLEKANGLGEPDLSKAIEFVRREIRGPDWKQTFVCETEHYTVFTGENQALADEIGKHAELIHRTYSRIFKDIKKEKRKFPIVVFGSAEEYHENGGPPQAGGHYNPLLRKLYIFKYPKDRDTKLVLYHEGFHQFLHDYLEDAPQWFNEGLADFFGPSRYVSKTGKTGNVVSEGMELRPNPWRLKAIQMALKAGRVRPWRDLMLMSQRELYDPRLAGLHYAQSWSIVYFLIRGDAKPSDNAGPHFQVLASYFAALRKGLGQEEAFNASFGKCDLAKLEEKWKSFILSLPAEAEEPAPGEE